jgi:phosphoribosylformylglycinamidine synthase PurS subunit
VLYLCLPEDLLRAKREPQNERTIWSKSFHVAGNSHAANSSSQFGVRIMYLVEIVVGNKPQAKDPEGQTIMKDLMHKSGYDCVRDVRTGKLLKVQIEANSEEEAKQKAFDMCNDLRIYNPVAHYCKIEIRGKT